MLAGEGKVSFHRRHAELGVVRSGCLMQARAGRRAPAILDVKLVRLERWRVAERRAGLDVACRPLDKRCAPRYLIGRRRVVLPRELLL